MGIFFSQGIQIFSPFPALTKALIKTFYPAQKFRCLAIVFTLAPADSPQCHFLIQLYGIQGLFRFSRPGHFSPIITPTIAMNAR